jgi:hypothetical protein
MIGHDSQEDIRREICLAFKMMRGSLEANLLHRSFKFRIRNCLVFAFRQHD